ncbi:hypothetical protein ACFLSV_00335 [Bacteroidota bacterium]
MILELESGKTIKNPKYEDFPVALSELENETSLYAILWSNTNEFIQTMGNKTDGYKIEYQEGSIEKHYQLESSFTLEQVTTIFRQYVKGDNSWKEDFVMMSNKLSSVFEFSDEDLNSNRMNQLTPKQKKVVQRYLKGRNFGLKLATFVMVGSVIFFIIMAYLTNDIDSSGFETALPYLLVVLFLFIGIFLFFTIFGILKSRDLKTGRISKVEGVVNKSYKSLKKKKYANYILKIGGTYFPLYTPAQYNTFENGKGYCVYYIKNPNANIILSVEEF